MVFFAKNQIRHVCKVIYFGRPGTWRLSARFIFSVKFFLPFSVDIFLSALHLPGSQGALIGRFVHARV